jgi:hypothetical protein
MRLDAAVAYALESVNEPSNLAVFGQFEFTVRDYLGGCSEELGGSTR